MYRVLYGILEIHRRGVGRNTHPKGEDTVIAVSELAGSSVNLVVRPWVKTQDYWNVRFDLTEKIKMTFDEEGISIPFPQRDLHIIDGDAIETKKAA